MTVQTGTIQACAAGRLMCKWLGLMTRHCSAPAMLVV